MLKLSTTGTGAAPRLDAALGAFGDGGTNGDSNDGEGEGSGDGEVSDDGDGAGDGEDASDGEGWLAVSEFAGVVGGLLTAPATSAAVSSPGSGTAYKTMRFAKLCGESGARSPGTRDHTDQP